MIKIIINYVNIPVFFICFVFVFSNTKAFAYDPNNKFNPHILIFPAKEEKKYAALTFDDGPQRTYTTMILDALKEHNAHATFFVLGHKIPNTEDIIKRCVDEGHSVGCHTYNHLNLVHYKKDKIEQQLDMTNALIREITGVEINIIRPPYGNRNDTVISLSKEKNMSVILWSIDPRDWSTKNPDKISDAILNSVKDGDIILLHDVFKPSAIAAVKVIEELTRRGFELVTVQELIEIKAGKMIPGGIYKHGFGTDN